MPYDTTGIEPVTRGLIDRKKLPSVPLYVPAGVEPAAISVRIAFPAERKNLITNYKALLGYRSPLILRERQIFIQRLLAALLVVCAEVESAGL